MCASDGLTRALNPGRRPGPPQAGAAKLTRSTFAACGCGSPGRPQGSPLKARS